MFHFLAAGSRPQKFFSVPHSARFCRSFYNALTIKEYITEGRLGEND